LRSEKNDESVSLYRLLSIVSEVSKSQGGGELNPWIISYVLPPPASLGVDGKNKAGGQGGDKGKRRYSKTGDGSGSGKGDPIKDYLYMFVGIKKDSIQKAHWHYVSGKAILPQSSINYVNELTRALEDIYGRDNIIQKEYTTEKRFYVGIGGLSAWESGIASLAPFGVPWIPGSTLKGAMRSRLLSDIVEDLVKRGSDSELLSLLDVEVDGEEAGQRSRKTSKLEDLSKKELDEILASFREKKVQEDVLNRIRALFDLFGSKKSMGKLISIGGFPVAPEGSPILGVDVVNPHYLHYYSRPDNPQPPGDWGEPKPFFLPVVEKGVTFKFLLVLRDADYRDVVERLLNDVLTFTGLGAKTSSDYGIFKQRNAGR